MNLIHPDPDCDQFADCPLDLRRKIQRWMQAFSQVDFSTGSTSALQRVASAMKVSVGTATRYYYSLKASDGHWTAIADGRRAKRIIHNGDGTQSREFRNWITGLAEDHHRNSKAAYRKFKTAWAARENIPGFQDYTGWPDIPFSYRTFARIIQQETDKRRLRSIRVSTSSKSGANLAQVLTTRVGLYPGAVYQFDDVWHDNFVTLGRDPVPKRVLELGVLDLFSGCRFHYGCKPRMKNAETGVMESLKEREMRFFLAGVLWNFGTSPRGTRMMVEHGTAALREDVIAILHDSGLGISVDRQPIEGKQAALTGYWPGTEGGNFRAKAALESLHNLIHNDLSNLALQTGSHHSGIAAPVNTDRQLTYIKNIVSEVLKKVPHRAELLRLPSLDFHAQFLPLLRDYYEFGLNGRTEHELEGWEALGFLTTEYTAIPGSGQFLNSQQFLDLPRESQAIIAAASKSDPKNWTRRRKLSPLEVWNSGRSDLRRAPAPLICDILGKDLGREVTVRGSYIRFRDQDISPDEMIYQARAIHLNGAQRELRDGEKFLAFANPFSPDTLFLLDAHDRYLGHCQLENRITATDRQALIVAAGQKAHRNAEILQPLRNRHAEQVQDAQDMREHNRRVVTGEAVTPEEKAADRSAAAHRAVSTRRANEWEATEPESEGIFEDTTPQAAPIAEADIADWLND